MQIRASTYYREGGVFVSPEVPTPVWDFPFVPFSTAFSLSLSFSLWPFWTLFFFFFFFPLYLDDSERRVKKLA